MQTPPFRIAAISGSMRRGSFNRALLRAAQEVAPTGVLFDVIDLASVPFYDGDVEAEGDPSSVRLLKAQIRQADALLIATPEYNGSYPGLLKNALDWASRPRSDSSLRGKPVAVVGASPGPGGTVRAQEALRQLLAATGTDQLPEPTLRMSHAGAHFDADGNLTDPDARQQLHDVLVALRARAGRATAPEATLVQAA